MAMASDKLVAWTGFVTGIFGTIGVIVVGAFNYYAATGSDKVKVDLEMIGFAKVILQDPQSSLAMRYWAVDVLGTWQGVLLTPERKKEIAEELQKAPVKTLDKIPAAGLLNQMLKADPIWNDIRDVEDILSVPDVGAIGGTPQGEKLPDAIAPMPAPFPKDGTRIEQLPGTGNASPELLEQQ